MSDFGADVIKVEPEGDPEAARSARRCWPGVAIKRLKDLKTIV
jgi:crotonobetainyl-CoA:carnitine CoA-transferase CaiB-like acyl-CoA transferase